MNDLPSDCTKVTLGHALELNLVPLLVLVCFLALVAMTGGVIACIFSQHSSRSRR